jgi:hypothetical protein
MVVADEKDLELLDWFAGQALQGLLAGPNAPKKSGAESPQQYAVRLAEEAYVFAGAMLRARDELGQAADGEAPGGA